MFCCIYFVLLFLKKTTTYFKIKTGLVLIELWAHDRLIYEIIQPAVEHPDRQLATVLVCLFGCFQTEIFFPSIA